MRIIKYALIVIVFLVLIVVLAGKQEPKTGGFKPSKQAGACLNAGGNYLSEFNECENVGAEQCVAIGGTFNECASACRNDPGAEFCTMQCVQVCEFE